MVIFGGVDTAHFTGAFVYADVLIPSYWLVGTEYFLVGGKKVHTCLVDYWCAHSHSVHPHLAARLLLTPVHLLLPDPGYYKSLVLVLTFSYMLDDLVNAIGPVKAVRNFLSPRALL